MAKRISRESEPPADNPAPIEIGAPIVVSRGGSSEYETVRSHLEGATEGATLTEASKEARSAAATASGIPVERFDALVASAALAEQARVPAELIYGLTHKTPATKLDDLLTRDPKTLRASYTEALRDGVIAPLANDASYALDRLVSLSVDRIPVKDLGGTALEHSASLTALLNREKVSTLADLRRLGGLSFLPDLSDADRVVAQRLDSQARLLSLVPDVALTAKLITSGYSTIADVAHATPEEIAASTGTPAASPLITELVGRAKDQVALVQSVGYAVAGAQASGLQSVGGGNGSIGQVVGQTCACEDCEAAVSPLAYLADLMKYALDHVRNSGQRISLPFLESTFHQPFGSLPADCSAMDEQLHQVRLCIEVLRSYLGARPLADTARETALQQAERHYLLNAYQLLLSKLGTSFTDIRLSRAATAAEQQRIADSIGVDVAALPGLFLDPAGALSPFEQALEAVFGLRDTKQSGLRPVPPLTFRNARVFFLRQTWRSQDWPADDYSARRRPIVDPDLVGPDDFRVPYPKTGPAAIDKAFDIWMRRRGWIDTLLSNFRAVPMRQVGTVTGPDFAAIVRAVGSAAYVGQNPIWPATAIADIRSGLRQITAANTDATRTSFNTNYGLDLDAARRLIELADKDAAYWATPARATPLEASEWEDLYAVLVGAKKTILRAFWIREEVETVQLRAQAGDLRMVWADPQDAGLMLLGQREFWKAVRAPQVGEWPPTRTNGVPLIDPDLVRREDLPEPTAGRSAAGNSDARTVWDARAAELLAKRGGLLDLLNTQGFDPMMTDVMGAAPGGAPWTTYLRGVNADLVGTDATRAATARQTVEQTLRLSLEQFQQLLTVMENQAGPAGQPLPTSADWADVIATLTTSWKIRTRFAAWYTEETNTATGLEAWRCLRHALPKWRATAEDRNAWQRALEARSGLPVVDPDMLVSTAYFRTPGSGNPWTIWDRRRTAIGAKYQSLVATTRTLAAFEQLADTEIGAGALTEMQNARTLGTAIAPRLQQWNLSFDACNVLLRTLGLLAATPAQPVLDSEWNAAASVFVSVWKTRQIADWKLEEQAQGVWLDPTPFQLPQIDVTQFPPVLPPSIDPWRASSTALLDWQDRLQSRLDATSELDAALANAVSDVEEATLPALRDALVVAAAPAGRAFLDAQHWLGDRLAIATEYGGCHKTTRITQAIETLQGIIWGVRTGILADHYPGLTLDAPYFDEEWQWIGSYATWRSAMFVFLYPENILLPSLRGHQTPGFQRFVDELRGGRRVTPAVARAAADRYAEYFRDVCSLSLDALQDGVVAMADGDHTLRFIFARAANSGKLYWATLDQGSSEFALSFWDAIPGAENVRAVAATAVYELAGGRRFVCLFVISPKDGIDELALLRYESSSTSHRWSDPIALAGPPNATSFEAALIDRSANSAPLGIRFRLPSGVLYERMLNVQGDDWASGDWVALDRYWNAMVRSGIGVNQLNGTGGLSALIENDENVIRLFAVGNDGTVRSTQWNDYLLNPTTKIAAVQTLTAPAPAGGAVPTFSASAEVRAVRRWNGLTALFLTDTSGRPWELVLSTPQTAWKIAGGGADNGTWSTTITTGANVAPAALSLRPNNAEVMIFLARNSGERGGNSANYDPDNTQQARWLAASDWGMWFDTHNSRRKDEPYWPVDSAVTAISRAQDVIDLFIAGDDNILYTAHTEDKGVTWAPWAALPGSPRVTSQTRISAASPTRSTLELFLIDSRGICRTIQYDTEQDENDGWSNWSEIGGNVRFSPGSRVTPVVVSENHVMLFVVGADDQVRATWKMNAEGFDKWQPWSRIPNPSGVALRQIGVVTRPTPAFTWDQVVLFAVADNGEILWSASEQFLPMLAPYLGSFIWKPDAMSLTSTAITERLTAAQRSQRNAAVAAVYAANWAASGSVLSYLQEAFYFVPVHLALQLQSGGYFIAALDWLRLVYDYSAPQATRILVGLPPEPANATDAFIRSASDWLLDPLNPHAIAVTRHNAYTRFSLMSISRCMLAYADSEFTLDTSESVPRARELYETVLELLSSSDLRQSHTACDDVIGELQIKVADPEWHWLSAAVQSEVSSLHDPFVIKTFVAKLNATFSGTGTVLSKFEAAQPILADIRLVKAHESTYAERLKDGNEKGARLESAVLARPDAASALGTLMSVKDEGVVKRPGGAGGFGGGVGGFGGAAFSFCVPANPLLRALRLRADLNLYKLRNCRNIAGMPRQLDPFAAPTDTVSGMPAIGSAGQLVIAGPARITPTVYRYAVLIDRAKQLVQQAMQLEAAFLAALEKSDKEAFDLLTARSNVRLAEASVRLQDLRIAEAQDGVEAAQLQRERAQIQFDTYDEWINRGLMPAEQSLLGLYDTMAVFQIVSANLGALMQGITGGIAIGVGGPFTAGIQAAFQSANALKGISDSLAINAQREISRLNVMIALEQRTRDWTLQKALAEQDSRVADQQITLANDQVRITEQERTIEQMKADQARDVMDFISNKFTNKELYDWMSGVLAGVYSVLLQEATSTAKLAAAQLAFERQEPPPTYIQDDYWEAPADATASDGSLAPDRRGLTGSARLLQDISQLDQYAFEKNQRKQQLTKTISLAQFEPLQFQRFLETGILPFVTPMELFDRDFPGHYLRLIRRVRTTVIALIPPTYGIRATLTASGISRAVIGGDMFQTAILRRPPESVALSAPTNATGVFDLQDQPEILSPFEGHGVATSWEFRLPKAANLFEFSTIVDVLITIEYTALDSFDYRAQMIQQLNAKRTLTADRAFSFRQQFADAWYDLHNPDQTPTPLSVHFKTVREDFAPGLDNMRIAHVTLYFARAGASSLELDNVDLRLIQSGSQIGGICRTDQGVISTQAGNGAPWLGMRDLPPFADWELTLPDTEQMRAWMNGGDIRDILFIVTYAGRLPEWPA